MPHGLETNERHCHYLHFAPPLFVVSGLGNGHDLFYNFTAVFPIASHDQVHKQVRP